MRRPNSETLRALFKRDPVAFERLRQELIEQAIRNAHPDFQRRLRGLQFQIDGIRQTARSPLDCSVKMQRLLDKKLDELRYAILRDNLRREALSPSGDNVVHLKQKDGPN